MAEVTDGEHEQPAGDARQARTTPARHIRTRCGLQVRKASLPGTDQRGDEEDGACERLKRLGLKPKEYFERGR